jgi:hypothetical protein
MVYMMLYVLALWWFPLLCLLMVFSISFVWILDWITWHFGEDEYVELDSQFFTW